MRVEEDEFGNVWKPVCAICQHMIEKEKEPTLDDDCECRLPPRRKPRPEDIRFWCVQDKHLKLNFVTGEKYPVPCIEYNKHGACRDFEALVPTEPTFTLEENVITLELPLDSVEGTVIYYRIKPTALVDDEIQDESVDESVEQDEPDDILWEVYENPITITEEVLLEYVSVLANSRSDYFSKVCEYTEIVATE